MAKSDIVIPPEVIKLYNFALFCANKNPRSSETYLFLTELFYRNREAFESCCDTISSEIIGG